MKYFLSISGHVSLNKCREFEQTIQFIFNQLTPGCLKHHLTEDVFYHNTYHIYLVWNSIDSLSAFKSSNEFTLLKGAFQTLGASGKVTEGKWADIGIFEVDEKLQ
jgi:hypothetical protein